MKKLIRIAFAMAVVFACVCGQIWAEGIQDYYIVDVGQKTDFFSAKEGIAPKSKFSEDNSGRLAWSFRTNGVITSSPALGEDGTIYIGNMQGNFYGINPDGTKKWVYKAQSSVISSPVIGPDGTIYFSSTNYVEQNKKNFAYALDPNGVEKWKYEIKPSANENPGIVSTPAFLYDGLIALSNNRLDSLIFIDPQTGKPDTRKQRVPKRFSSANSNFCSINPWGQICMVGYRSNKEENQTYSSIVLINSDGAERWHYDFPKVSVEGSLVNPVIFGTPVTDENGNIYIGTMECKMYSFDSNGGIRWVKNFKEAGDREDYGIACSAAIDEEFIYFVTQTGKACCLRKRDGSVVWLQNLGLYIISSPALTKAKEICFGAQGGIFVVLDATTGSIKWQEKTSNGISSSPVVNWQGVAYVGCIDSCLYAFNLGENSGLAQTCWPMYGRDQRHTIRADAKLLLADNENLPVPCGLGSAYPNPFNSSIIIPIMLTHKGKIDLSVFNMSGQKIFTVFSGKVDAGRHSFVWRAGNLSSGVYFCCLSSEEATEAKKIVFLK